MFSRCMKRVRHTIPNKVFQENYLASGANFWSHFRMTQEGCFDLLTCLITDLGFEGIVCLCIKSGVWSHRRLNQKNCIAVFELVAATLYYMMHGVSMKTLQLIFGISSAHINNEMNKVHLDH